MLKNGVRIMATCLAFVLTGGAVLAVNPIKEAKFTQVINQVSVVKMPRMSTRRAKVKEVLKSPDLVQTGLDSMAELLALDKTITRIGANTVFSFESGRDINLKQGSILFHTPHGKGGGTIKSGGASATVLGTTIMVVATEDGGFKTIVLEGKAQIRLPNGDFRILKAGQLGFVLPGSKHFGPVLDINLAKLVKGAGLVNGFRTELGSIERVNKAVERQARLLASGEAKDTGMLVGRKATRDQVEVISASAMEQAVLAVDALQRARVTDAVGDVVALSPEHLFTGVEVDPLTGLPVTSVSFVARKLRLDGPKVDLNAFAKGGYDSFTYLAAEELNITGSVKFKGKSKKKSKKKKSKNSTSSYFQLALASEGSVNIAQGARLEAEGIDELAISSVDSLNLNNVGIQNDGGEVHAQSRGAVRLSNGSHVSGLDGVTLIGDRLVLTDSRVESVDGGAHLHGMTGDVDLNSSTVSSSLTVVKAGRDLTGSRVSFAGSKLVAQAARDFSIDGMQVDGSSLSFVANEMLTVRNSQLVNLQQVSMSARTLVLESIDFPGGSTVRLESEVGLLAPRPNTGYPVMPGFVNF